MSPGSSWRSAHWIKEERSHGQAAPGWGECPRHPQQRHLNVGTSRDRGSNVLILRICCITSAALLVNCSDSPLPRIRAAAWVIRVSSDQDHPASVADGRTTIRAFRRHDVLTSRSQSLLLGHLVRKVRGETRLQALNASLDGWLPGLDNVASGPGWLVLVDSHGGNFRYRGQP